MPRLVVRLALAALAAGLVWLAFTAGGARLFAWRLTHVAGVPVDVRRLGIGLGPPVLVAYDIRTNGARADGVRVPLRSLAGLWRRPAALRDAVLHGVRVLVPGERPVWLHVRRAELDRVDVGGPATRFAGRLALRDGRADVRGRWRAGRVAFAARLRRIDARSVAPLVGDVSLRGGTLDGRLHFRDGDLRGDLRARGLAVRRGPLRARAARLVVDGLALDGGTAVRRATLARATIAHDGVPPLRRMTAVVRATGDGAAVRLVARAALAAGRIRVRGTADTAVPAVDAAVKADRVAVAPLLAALPDLGVTTGRLSGRLHVAGPPWAATDATVTLERLALVEPGAADPRPAVACEHAVVVAERVDAKPLRARLRRASLDGLAVRLRRDESGLAPATALAAVAAWPSVQTALATPPEGSGPSDLPAFDVAWTAGTIAFEDRTIDPPARLVVADVGGELHQDAGPPPRHLSGAFGGRLYTASLEAGLATEGAHGHVVLDVDGLDASLFDPWLGPAVDVTATGTLAVHSEVDWDARAFAAPSRVRADGLAVDDRAGRRLLGLPLPRVVALAGDAGALDVAIPVSGAFDAAAPALAAALEAALASAVTGPVADVATGRPVVVPFAPGSDTLDDAGAVLVDRLAALLHQRPTVTIAIRGRTARDDAAPDAPALAAARATRVRERLCEADGVPAARVRTGAPAGDGPPGALVEPAS